MSFLCQSNVQNKGNGLSLTTGGLSGQREEENIAAQTDIGIIMEPNIGYRVATGHGEPLDNTYEYIQTSS